jgi:hypothetical protein
MIKVNKKLWKELVYLLPLESRLKSTKPGWLLTPFRVTRGDGYISISFLIK